MDSKTRWDQYFMSMMYLVAMKSKDPSTKIGAILVGPDHEIRSTGYNGLARGVNDETPERQVAPEKYFWYEHGERNSVYNAARAGIKTAGCTMYTNGVPCADCARACIQAGIIKIVVSEFWDKGQGSKWTESCARGATMLQEAGVAVEAYSGPYLTEISGLRATKPVILPAGNE